MMDKQRLLRLFWFESDTLRTVFWLIVFILAYLLAFALLTSVVLWIGLSFTTGNFWLLLLIPVVLYAVGLLGKVMPHLAAKVAGLI